MSPRRGWLTTLCSVLVAASAATGAHAEIPNVCVPELGLVSGWCGDGGPAPRALIKFPRAVEASPRGGYVFADGNGVIRRVSPSGIIGVAAASIAGARVDPRTVTDLSALPDGGDLVADPARNRVWRLSPPGVARVAAGSGRRGYGGDGGAATGALLSAPAGVDALPDGGFLVADTGNHRVRRVAPDGTITTVAGTGVRGFGGDGGAATDAALRDPADVEALAGGGFVIADKAGASTDAGVDHVRRVMPDGSIRTIPTPGVDALSAEPDGGFLVVAATSVYEAGPDEAVRLVAGNPARGCSFAGDGGRAVRAGLGTDLRVAALPEGGFLVADVYNHRIRRVAPDGTISTVAGGGGQTGPGGSECGASAEHPIWNGFQILRVTGGRHGVRVRLATTLAAAVAISLRRGSRTIAGRRLSVRGGDPSIRIGVRLSPGRYTVVARGRNGERHRSSTRSFSVR